MTQAPHIDANRNWVVDIASSHIGFAAKHLLVTTTRGHFARFTTIVAWDPRNLAIASVQATIDLKSIDTKQRERDEHLRDLFEVDRFPTATFTSKRVRATSTGYDVIGDLTMHGKTRELVLEVTAKEKGDRVVFDARTMLSRKEFGVQWNAAIELTSGVSDDVAIEIHVEAAR